MPNGADLSENIPRAIGWMLLATFFFVSLDALAKNQLQRYDVTQVVAVRFFFHLALTAVVVACVAPWAWRARNIGLQLLRSFFLMFTTFLFFTAVRTVPLADANAIMFMGPIFATVLSIPLLGERVGVRRWAGIAFSFAGAMLIIRPGSGFVGTGGLLLLCAAFIFAFYQIITRRLAKIDDPMTTILYTALVGAIVSSFFAPTKWVPPADVDWILMACMGLCGGVGHLCMIRAISSAPVSAVAPYAYTGLIWANVFGFMIFGDVPSIWTLAGAAIIASSGIYILYREQAQKAAAG